MRIDLSDAVRDALTVDVPELPLESIRARARDISHRKGAARLASSLAIAFVACLCVGVNGNGRVSHASVVVRQAMRTPAPCPAPDPQMS
jgi:hypothetical protein